MNSNLGLENLSRQIDLNPGLGGSSQEGARKLGESAGEGVSFGRMLEDSIEKVNTFQNQADKAIKELVSGRTKNVHETLLAVEKADASLKLMMQVRNKVLEAYKEIIKMQV